MSCKNQKTILVKTTLNSIVLSCLIILLSPGASPCQDQTEKFRFGIGVGYDFSSQASFPTDEHLLRILKMDNFFGDDSFVRSHSFMGRLRFALSNRLALGIHVENLTHKTELETNAERFPTFKPKSISIEERFVPIYFDASVRLFSLKSIHLWIGGGLTRGKIVREIAFDFLGDGSSDIFNDTKSVLESASQGIWVYKTFGEVFLGMNRNVSLWIRGGYRVTSTSSPDNRENNFLVDFGGKFIHAGLQIDGVW